MNNEVRLHLIGKGYDALHPGKGLSFEDTVEVLFDEIMPEHKIGNKPGAVFIDGDGTVSLRGSDFAATIDGPYIVFSSPPFGSAGIEITQLYNKTKMNFFDHQGKPSVEVDNLDQLARMYYVEIYVRKDDHSKRPTEMKIGKPKRVRMVHLPPIEGEKQDNALWNVAFKLLEIDAYTRIRKEEDGIKWAREIHDYGTKKAVLRVGHASNSPWGHVSVNFTEPQSKPQLAGLSGDLGTISADVGEKRVILRPYSFQWPEVVKYLRKVKVF